MADQSDIVPMLFRADYSRRQFVTVLGMSVGATLTSGSYVATGAETIDPRVAEIVAKTIGIDTHNHIDVSLTAAEMPGPDIDLAGEMKRSGLSAACMTFATDYQPGDAYDRFLNGLASMDRQLERNRMKRSLTAADIRHAHEHGHPTVIQSIEGGHFLEGDLERVEESYHRGRGILDCCTTATPRYRLEMCTPSLRALAD